MEGHKKTAALQTHPVVSRRLAGGGLVELIHRLDCGKTALATWHNGSVSVLDWFDTDGGERLVPVPATNNLIKHGAVLLPGAPEPYDSMVALVESIQAYLDRYVDLTDGFRRLASYYILLTWVYDAFNELPYLRLRGDFGTGKTRALIIIGSLCYKAFFASGASTVSPIFHTLDTFRGTLIFDEADFRFSDEKAELVKIFNNGNVKGFPVLRTAMTMKKEFDPRAFNVFGPKIVAMRRSFEDPALESRFLTEEMGQRALRADIPINLPDEQKTEAQILRSKLLMYRMENVNRVQIDERLVDRSMSARLNQILVPLLSIIDDSTLRNELAESLKGMDQALYAERSASAEAGVLEVLVELFEAATGTTLSVAEIASAFAQKFGSEYGRPITNRFVGSVLRKGLRLFTYKSHGVYVVPVTEKAKLPELCTRYGVTDRDVPIAVA